MGFSHEMASHHFLLFNDGGAIEIEAEDPNDSASKEAIRDRLVQIARMFSQGDFQLPILIPATVQLRPKESRITSCKKQTLQVLSYEVQIGEALESRVQIARLSSLDETR
jgi:hypothetical protein